MNTRSQFTLFNQLAVEAGWVLDWNQIDPHVFAHARTVAIYRDPEAPWVSFRGHGTAGAVTSGSV